MTIRSAEISSLPPVVQRFLRYVRIDTTSDPKSQSIPSTAHQKDLGRLLVEELHTMGVEDAEMDENGYVFATLPASERADGAPVLGLLAHMDTSADAPGKDVHPIVHPPYDGGILRLPGDPTVVLDPAKTPALKDHLGHNLITSDGTTLLGSDDKAGVAVLMQLAADLVADASLPRPCIRLCFTIDEEIGRGVDHLDLERLGADVAYTIDGAGTDTISTETFNAAEAVLQITGTMVHPGYAKDIMVNAATILVELLAELPAGEAPETTEDREGYFYLSTIQESNASIAGASFILRDFDAKGLERRKQFLQQLVERYRLRFPRAHFELEIRDQYRNMRAYIAESDERAVTFAYHAAEPMGMKLTEQLVRGGTDGARLSELGLPTPNIFNGGHDYHSCFEWNSVQNLERSLRYLTALVEYWATNGTRNPESKEKETDDAR